MNSFFQTIGFSLAVFLAPLVSHADATMELVEQSPTGTINWTRGIVSASATAAPGGDGVDGPAQAQQRALYRARMNLYETINRLRISNCHPLHRLVDSQEIETEQVKAMALGADVVHKQTLADGSVAARVQFSLFGGFAQLVLPRSVRQVEPIKPLSPVMANGNAPGKDRGPGPEDNATPEPYTGLIVDARGIGVTPSLVPVIMSESGHEVYGPAFVSREYAVQNGVCQYIVWNQMVAQLPRIAPNPLIIKGLRLRNGSCSEIVVSNADASKLKGSSLNLGFLKQCRVVIVLDRDHHLSDLDAMPNDAE